MFLVLQIPAFHVSGFTDSGFSCSWFYRFRLFMFLVFTDSGFSCSWFYRFRLFMFLVFTDSGFSCSWFYRFRFFMFLVLQIPALHVPYFFVPCSVPRSFPRFPVPCFTDSRMLTQTFTNINILPGQVSFRWRQDQLILHGRQDGKVVQKVARLLKMVGVQLTFLF